MKILNEERVDGKKSNVFVLILDKRETRTLVDIAKAAYLANRRRSTFRAWAKKLEDHLSCY